jgi:hypothetical protein
MSDNQLREVERQYLYSGTKEDAVNYINKARQVYGNRFESSWQKQYGKICINSKTNQISREVSYRSGRGDIPNYAFFDAIEIDTKLSRTGRGSPYIKSTSLIDGIQYPMSVGCMLEMIPFMRNGVVVGKFTFRTYGTTQSIVLEKE